MADIRNTFKAAGAKNTEELRRAVNNAFTDIAVQVNSALRNVSNGGTPGTPSANTVTTNTNQTITGNKTFTGNTTFSGNVDGIAFSEIDSRPTTISGYGITDALQLGTTSTTALAGNTPLLQLGTTSTTALAGNTPLLQLGTSATTALAGNTVVPDDIRLSGTDLELRSGSNTVGTAVDLSGLGSGSTVNNNGPFIRDEGGTVFTNRTNTIDFTGEGITASTTDSGTSVTVNVPEIPAETNLPLAAENEGNYVLQVNLPRIRRFWEFQATGTPAVGHFSVSGTDTLIFNTMGYEGISTSTLSDLTADLAQIAAGQQFIISRTSTRLFEGTVESVTVNGTMVEFLMSHPLPTTFTESGNRRYTFDFGLANNQWIASALPVRNPVNNGRFDITVSDYAEGDIIYIFNTVSNPLVVAGLVVFGQTFNDLPPFTVGRIYSISDGTNTGFWYFVDRNFEAAFDIDADSLAFADVDARGTAFNLSTAIGTTYTIRETTLNLAWTEAQSSTVDTTVTDGSTNAVSGGAVFTALEDKQDTITSTNRLNADLIANGTVSNTEFQTLNGVTSSIQTQLNNKVNSLEVPGGVSFTLGINQGTGGQSGLFTTSNDRVVFPIDNEVNAEAFFNSLPMSAIDALTSDVVVTFNGNSHTIPTGALVARNTTNTGTLGVNAVFFTFTGANTFFSGITAADREAGDDFSINANVEISGDITLTGGNNIDISGSGQEVTIDAVENYTLLQGTAATIPTVNQFGGKDIVYVYV